MMAITNGPASRPSSVVVRWADPDRIGDAVREYAADLRKRRPEVSRIYWYGSWISGEATPSSDADLCVVVEADERKPRERVGEYLPVRLPVGVDLVVLTEDEMEQLADRAPSWRRAIIEGREL